MTNINNSGFSLVGYRGDVGEPGDAGGRGEPGDAGHFIMEIKGGKGVKGPVGDQGEYHHIYTYIL
jgi:hypothetical protein